MDERVCGARDCDKPIVGRQKSAKFCSDDCKRREHAALRAGAAERRKAVGDRALTEDAIAEAAQAELRSQVAPVVREALTEDVLQGLAKLVQLTPQAAEAIEKDLQNENAAIRQNAYRALLKYTVGHGALVPTLTEDNQPMTVVIANMQRAPLPDSEVVPAEALPTRAPELPPPTIAEGQVLKECDTCHVRKPEDQFASLSDRCTDCFQRIRREALSAFGGTASGAG